MLTRRGFLAVCGGGVALASSRALAVGDGARFAIARLKYQGGNWDPRTGAVKRLLWELTKRTSVESRAKEPVVTLAEAALFRTPFLALMGDDAFARWGDAEIVALRRFLTRGGFLFVDGAAATLDGGFDASVHREIGRVFPDAPLAPLPRDHVVFKSFYLCRGATGRVEVDADLHGVEHDDRTVVIYSRNDLAGAWMRDNYGRWTHEVRPGGERQREMAFRLGINIVMYALCLDYKRDQVHVEHLLRRRTPYLP